jgi:hypothetical protein
MNPFPLTHYTVEAFIEVPTTRVRYPHLSSLESHADHTLCFPEGDPCEGIKERLFLARSCYGFFEGQGAS